MADGEISFDIINGEPYVKVGADAPRPFKGGAIDLGTGTTFDVSSYSGYENFTADNFLIKNVSNTSISRNGNVNGNPKAGENVASLESTMSLVKNYDPAIGVLTCYVKHYAYARAATNSSNVTTLTDTKNASVNVYLVI